MGTFVTLKENYQMKKKKKSTKDRPYILKTRVDAVGYQQAAAFCKNKGISKDTALHDSFFKRLSIYPLQFNQVVNLVQQILQCCTLAENQIKNGVVGEMDQPINGQTTLFQDGSSSKGPVVVKHSLQEIKDLANEIINKLKS